MIRVRVDQPHIYIRAPFVHRELCRELPTRQWIPATKEWRIYASVETARAFLDAFNGNAIEGDEEFGQFVQRVNESRYRSTHHDIPDSQIPGTKTKPWRHQAQAYWFFQDRNSVLLDMGMGTGKSKVVVDLVCSAARTSQQQQRVLILSPLSVVPVWPKQFSDHGWDGIEQTVVPLDDKLSVKRKKARCERERWSKSPILVFVCNYESARCKPLSEWLTSQTWDFCVLDESHKIKSPGSIVSRFCSRLRDHATKRLCLTGTPMPHDPLDIYAQFRFLDPGIFGTNFAYFRARYAIMGGFRDARGEAKNVIGYRNQDEMTSKMARITFQARSADVLDLPEFTHVQRYFSLNDYERKTYNELEKDFISKVKAGEIVASNALTKLLRLSQITGGFSRTPEGRTVRLGNSKRNLLEEILTSIGGDEPVVVFCRFHEDLDTVQEVCKALKRTCRELSGRKKELGGPVWESGNGNTLAAQLQSGGVGIDLTRARYCVYYSVDFSLGNYEQSLARVHRPGQTRPVTYVHLIAQDTIDEKVYLSLEKKKDVINTILSQIT
jgi:SNF2 family DNA or RNA helicase